MPGKEAAARIKINELLEAAGWRFFPDGEGPANIRLEPTVAIKPVDLDSLGENFEKANRGFVSTPAVLDTKIVQILRDVDEMQNHSRPVIERCSREFLIRSGDLEEREYPEPGRPDPRGAHPSELPVAVRYRHLRGFDVESLRGHGGIDGNSRAPQSPLRRVQDDVMRGEA